jgi:hypothetical protein
MEFVLRYKNVPRFCFFCGRMGHATASCPDGEPMDQVIKFGEEL